MSGFDTTPGPAFYRTLQNQRWTVAGALSELVDNGFGPGRGDARRVTITYEPKRRVISVLDDGQGMDAVGRLFTIGNTIGLTPGDIGTYGSGGTMALLWLASRVEIWTLRDGRLGSDELEWRRPRRVNEKTGFPIISDEWCKPTIRNTPTELLDAGHGTLIKLHLARERSFYPSNAQRDLAQTYAPALRMGRELIWRTVTKAKTTARVLSDPMPTPEPDKCIDLDLTLIVRDEDSLSVTGRIGVVDGLPTSRSVVSVGYGSRVILKTRDCYASADGEEKFLGTGVAGWVQLGDGWRDYLGPAKDWMHDQPAWQVLMATIFEKIRPLLEEVEDEEVFLELEDLRLNLQEALNGQVLVEVPRAARRPRDGRRTDDSTPKPRDEPEEREKPEAPPADDSGDQAKERKPGQARVLLVEKTDEQMEGELCRVQPVGSTVYATLNKEHPVIRTALKARPVNRMALNLLVTRELADAIVSDEALLKIAFPPRVLRLLADREDPASQKRYVSRLLLDGVADTKDAA